MLGLIRSLPSVLALAAGALIGAALAYQVGHWAGDISGYQRRIAEVQAADAKASRERKSDDAKLQALDDHALCVEYLRARGLPIEDCEQLRGLRGQ